MKSNLTATLFVPLFLLFVLTVIFRLTDLDVTLSGIFYSPEKGFFLKDTNPWKYLYDHGNLPSLILSIGGLFFFIAGFCIKKLLPYRKISLFLIVFMIIGPGLIVNTVFKNHWGRPRPCEIVQFGGQQQFLPVWEKGISGEGKSFPSGHASVGFYLMAPFFFLCGNQRDKKWGIIFLILGISYGTAMGITRIIQGGHFASDVLWSAGFLYFTGLGLHHFFQFDKGMNVDGQRMRYEIQDHYEKNDDKNITKE